LSIKLIWSGEEEEELRRLYPVTDRGELSVLFGRSVASIDNKASRMGLRKREVTGKLCEGLEPETYVNSFVLLSRREALRLDRIDLLRINWSLAEMYQRELCNPGLGERDRHRLMMALSNHTSIINNIMGEAEEDVREEELEESLESRFLEILTPDPESARPRRVVLDLRCNTVAVR